MNAGFTTESPGLENRRWRRNWSDTARSWLSPEKSNWRGVSSLMASDHLIRRCRNWYTKLLCLYPKPYRKRFGEPMEQTFTDLCRERAKAKRGLFGLALWMFFETSAAIIRENLRFLILQRN